MAFPSISMVVKLSEPVGEARQKLWAMVRSLCQDLIVGADGAQMLAAAGVYLSKGSSNGIERKCKVRSGSLSSLWSAHVARRPRLNGATSNGSSPAMVRSTFSSRSCVTLSLHSPRTTVHQGPHRSRSSARERRQANLRLSRDGIQSWQARYRRFATGHRVS